MKTSTGFLAATAAFAVQLVAASEVSDFIETTLHSSAVERRQLESITLDDIPAACQPSCTTIIDAYNTCTDTACLCSSDSVNGYAGCLSCLLGPSGSSTVQSYVDELVDTCISAGEDTSSVTVSGGSSATGTAEETSFTAPGGSSVSIPASEIESASSALESLTDIFSDSSFDIPSFSTPSGQSTRSPTPSADPTDESGDDEGPVSGGEGDGGDGALALKGSAFVGFVGAIAAGMLML